MRARLRLFAATTAILAAGAGTADAAIDFQRQTIHADAPHSDHPVLSDLDGDGLADLVAGRTFAPRRADGSFAPPVTWIDSTIQGFPVATHDQDDDTRLDIVTARQGLGENCEYSTYRNGGWDGFAIGATDNASGNCTQAWGNAAFIEGEPGALTAFKSGSTNFWLFVESVMVAMGPSSATPRAVAGADLNGDKRDDLVGLLSDGQVYQSLRSGYGFATATSTTGGSGATALAAGDLNNDGKAEIITASPTTVTVRTASGFVSNWSMPANTEAVDLALADVDGDGWQDMLIATAGTNVGGQLLVRMNRGALVFDSPVGMLIPYYGQNFGLTVANGRDGRLDAVAVGGGGESVTVFVNRSTASAAFATATTSFWDVEVGTSSEPQALTFKNTGYDTLRVEKGHLTGLDADSYKLVSDGCQGAVLKRNQTCTFSVRFAPIADGIRNAALRVLHDGDGAATQTALTGIGTVPATAARSQAQPTPASAAPAPAPAPVVAVAGPQGPKGDPGRDGRDGRDGSLQCAGSAGVCTLDLALSPGVIRVSAELRRAGRLVARGKARPGSRLRLDAKRKLRPGRYRLRLVRIGRDGARTVVNRTIRIR